MSEPLDSMELPEKKKRKNYWYSGVMILFIAYYTLLFISYILFGDRLEQDSTLSHTTIILFTVLCGLNIVFHAGMLAWKKWGYWGLLLIKLIVFVTYGLEGLLTDLSHTGQDIVIVIIVSAFVLSNWKKLD
jgi:uncharacterized membrane protein YhaH (DUF805 family)